MLQLKLGRKKRAFNPKIPHMSALLMRDVAQTYLPPSVNYAPASISNFGMMLNDQIGDCSCAGYYHALQVWSLCSGRCEYTQPDQFVLNLYEQVSGFNPAKPESDQGCVLQNVLTYLLNEGAPTDSGPHKIDAFFEVDPRNLQDVKRTIYECGVAYIGFEVPSSLLASLPPPVWNPDTSPIEGGHCVILTGYDDNGFDVISWGSKYRMSNAFFTRYVDEVYGIADKEWIETTGKTPCGLSLQDLELLMHGLR